MEKWYELDGALNNLNQNAFFLEKYALDEELPSSLTAKKVTKKARDCSWARKRKHKKKLYRKFLSGNPDLNIPSLNGMRACGAIYLNSSTFYEGYGFYDSRQNYDFNCTNNIYLSQRGDLRIFHGLSFPVASGSFALSKKDKNVVKITNRRIRQNCKNEDDLSSFSRLKKLYQPYDQEMAAW